jgi:hypothetical protein
MRKITPFFITLLLLLFASSAISQSIVINEILTSNTTVNQDEDGTYQDWVELYNKGAVAVNLTGFGLTDDATLPYKWTFPNVSVGAGQYLLVWCSDKNRTVPGSPLHTNFKISSSGEAITLTNASAVTVDVVPSTVIAQNISYGRLPNGTGSFTFFAAVTPAAVNSSVGYSEVLAPPTFSHESGFLTAGFSLTISTTIPGATILYTLDGSEPSATNLSGTTYHYKNQYPFLSGQTTGPQLTKTFTTLQYSAPLAIADRSAQPNKIANISTTYDFTPTYIPTAPIFKGTVVRAKVVKAGALDSKTITKSFYISPQGAARFSLPVASLSIDENKLFDYTDGIMVAGVDFDNWRLAHLTDDAPTEGDIANFMRHGRENERTTNFTYFVNGAEVLNQDVGLRVHGGSSRTYRDKSLTVYSRSDYGDDTMSYKFFSDQTFDNFKGLVMHNSGNDYDQTMFRDALCHKLSKSLNFTTKGYQPAATFINGEYWGMLSFRDKIDDDYFERVYNIATTDIQVLENEYWLVEGDGFADYTQIVDYLNANSLAVQANYDYMLTRIDPESFKDYFISNIFLENADWPVNNIVYWRKNVPYTPNAPYGHDGRWRWMAHDMDDTFGISNGANYNLNSLAAATDPNGPEWPNAPWSTLLLRKMLVNPGFKNDFINRFADLLNTSFLTSRILSSIADMKAQIAPCVQEHFARWETPLDNGDWEFFLGEEIAFANQRPAFQRNHIRSKFTIASNINATLNVSDPSHGYIKMNTINVKVGTDGITSNPYPWTGIYFSNIPVTLKAIANPGFTFSHWTGASASTNPEITINSAANFNITAVFVPQVIASSEPIYYWFMNSAIENNLPLQTLNTTFKLGTTDGVINYQSCLVGYPFTAVDPNWRKASMERRNSPIDINYFPALNSNLTFANSDMKGLQIKEPLQNGSLGNTMVFNFTTVGYKEIKFSFAAINELTNANAILVDYAVNAGTPVWLTTGLASSSLPLTAAFQLFNVDFTAITAANNNPNFKVRLRFAGTNMTADTGARITFNNIAVFGTQQPLAVAVNDVAKFSVFPNPFSDVVNIIGVNETQTVNYQLFTIDGKLIKNGMLDHAQVNLNDLSKGMYLLQLSSEGKTETKKIIKK